MLEIALFPIPGVVAFPGQSIQLHIFEPRYRKMVEDAEKEHFLIGICPPGDIIRKAKTGQKLQDVLNSNQSYYHAQKILGCGAIESRETLQDGRILLSLGIKKKVFLHDETQLIPYQMGKAEEMLESSLNNNETDSLFAQTIEYAIKILGPGGSSLLSGFASQNSRDLLGLVNKVASWPFFSPPFQQEVLELEFAEEKARRLIEVLEKFPAVKKDEGDGSPEFSH